jgi:hypothetical protein
MMATHIQNEIFHRCEKAQLNKLDNDISLQFLCPCIRLQMAPLFRILGELGILPAITLLAIVPLSYSLKNHS